MGPLGTSGIDNEIIRWLIIITGILLLFFGAVIYYSALRFFGAIVGASAGIIIAINLLRDSPTENSLLILFYILAALFGGLIGASLTMVFHHIIFFIAGAIIGLILFKMFALGLVTPYAFNNLTMEKFIDLIKPGTAIEAGVMIIGGIIYLASAHLLIVVTMALVGSYLIAWALNIYILFPILAPIGAILQWAMTRRKKVIMRSRKIKVD